EDNNATAGNRIGVGNKPDFIVTQVSTVPSAISGSQVQVTVTYCKQGTTSGSVPVDLYFSADAAITSADTWAGSLPPGPTLQPGGCSTQSTSAWVPSGPDNVYYAGAIADSYGSIPELIEDNNALAGTRIGVGYAPDLIVTLVSAPASVMPGSPL